MDLEFASISSCLVHDEYGDNQCHFNWGDEVTATVSFSGEELQADDVIRGSLKLAGWISYTFHCAVCGQDCVLQLPVFHHRNVTIAMPKTCPIPADAVSETLTYQMWDESPTGGTVAVHFEGNLVLIQGRTDTTLIDVHVEGFIK